MRQAAAEAVEFCDDQGVAWAEVVEGGGELGPVSQGAAGLLFEDPVAACLGERVELGVSGLVGGADAGVADQSDA